MQQVRVYLPASSTVLRELVERGELSAPLTAFAVTAGLRAHYTDAADATDATDAEDLEYAALSEAARASLRLIDADPTAWRRRVVLAADVPDAVITDADELDLGVVRVVAPVTLAQIASAHLDDVDVIHTVGAAAAAIMRADLGDLQAQEVVDDAEGNELSWYATQELGVLLELG